MASAWVRLAVSGCHCVCVVCVCVWCGLIGVVGGSRLVCFMAQVAGRQAGWLSLSHCVVLLIVNAIVGI